MLSLSKSKIPVLNQNELLFYDEETTKDRRMWTSFESSSPDAIVYGPLQMLCDNLA